MMNRVRRYGSGRGRSRALFGSLLGTLFAACAVSPTAGADVLVNQIDLTSPESSSSQDFESMFDTSDTLTVDDFQVPAGESWQLDSALIRGAKFGSSTTSTVNVTIFADATGAPAGTVFSGQVQAADYPNFTVPLASIPPLQAGTYWFGVQAVLNGVDPDPMLRQQWFWRENNEGQFGNAAMFRNPGGAISPACTSFGPRSTCLGAGHEAHDQSFLLSGARTVVSGPPPPQPPPPVDVTAPQTSIKKSPGQLRLSGRRKTVLAKFRFAASETGSKFSCRVDSAAFKRCVSPFSVKLKKGTHTFRVRATDAAGNVDGTAAKARVKVLGPKR